MEPFVGGGAVLFDVLENYALDEVYIGDLNEELINLYTNVRNHCQQLIVETKKLENVFLNNDENSRKQFYYSCRELYNDTELTTETRQLKAALFLFLNKTCFNGLYRVNKDGGFNVPIGSRNKFSICNEEELHLASEALQNVTIYHGRYEDSLNFIDASTFVYLDPPYKPISKTESFNSYTSSTFGDSEQVQLASFAKDISTMGASVLLSNSNLSERDREDSFFQDLYEDFEMTEVIANRRVGASQQSRGLVKEWLIRG